MDSRSLKFFGFKLVYIRLIGLVYQLGSNLALPATSYAKLCLVGHKSYALPSSSQLSPCLTKCTSYSPDLSSSQLFQTYSNANHGGCKDSDHSTSAYVVKIGTGVISWMSKFQPIVTLSTTEAEYVVACKAGKEIIWMCKLLQEIGFESNGPLILHMDNQSAIQVAKHPEHHGRMKHLDLRWYWL